MAMAQCIPVFGAAPWRSPSFSPSYSSSSTSRRKFASSYRPITMEFYLKPLPFEMDALEPYMSKQTLEIHWGKHQRSYVDNLNKQIAGTELECMQLDELLKFGYNNSNPTAYFNNASQVWNHDFFWQSIKPGGGKQPTKELLYLIKRDLGSFEAFVDEFKQAAGAQFGSGWAWLVAKEADPLTENKFAKLAIEKTHSAVNPLVLGHIPLLTIDVWEHAYYLDYQNQRADYVSTFIDELISWETVTSRLEQAKRFLNFYDVVVPLDEYEYL